MRADMLCQDTYWSRYRRTGNRQCIWTVKWVARGPGYTKFVCGYHRRAYTKVESIQHYLERH